jgi:copper chaperone CopZ
MPLAVKAFPRLPGPGFRGPCAASKGLFSFVYPPLRFPDLIGSPEFESLLFIQIIDLKNQIMQKLFITTIIFLFGFAAIPDQPVQAQTAPASNTDTRQTQPVFTQAELIASGLTCSMCSNSIYKALVQLPFVAHVSPDVEHSSFLITLNSRVPVDIDALKQKVREAGFSVSSLTLTMDVHDLSIRDDAHVDLGGKTFHFMHVKPQMLNGIATVRVIDKDFLSSREYKQYAAYTTMPCYKTGKMEPCCNKTGEAGASTRIYHVTI